MRLTAAALVLCAIALTACSKGNGSTPDAGDGSCTKQSQCGAKEVCDKAAGKCIPICDTTADCASPQVCEDGLCVNPGCGADVDCQSSQVCLGGSCTSAPAASQVSSCDLTPSPAVVHAGKAVQLVAIAKDASGAAIPFKGITYAATGSTSVSASGLVTGIAGAAATGTGTVTATAGTRTCTSAIIVYNDATTAGSIRVAVIDSQSKRPVSGAFVVVDGNTAGKATTDATGLATLTAAAGAHDVHVFAANYNYTSYIGTTATDIYVPLTSYIKLARRSGFQAEMTSSDFTPLNEKDQIVHLAFFGSGISNSILDFSLDTLIGPSRHVVIVLAGTHPVDLPSGLIIGVGDDLFGTGTYKMFADPGTRALWGLGGNVDIALVLKAVAPLLEGSGANVDVGALLPQLLPLLGKLQAGAVVGVKAADPVIEGGTPTFTTQKVPLNAALRLHATATAPDLPKVNGDYVDGVIALVGSTAYPMGFIPLGVTAGLVAKNGTTKTAKVNDPTCTVPTSGTNPCATSKLPIKLAPQNNGLEGNKYGAVLLALNFGGLTPGSTNDIAVSGIVQAQDTISYADPSTAGPQINYARGFPALAGTGVVGFNRAQRKFSITGDVEASTQIYRFEVENAARQNWNIWMGPAGARTVTLINPHDVDPSLIDPMADATPQDGSAAKGPSARIIGVTTTDPGQNYARLTGFNSLTLDELGNSLSAFTVATVTLQ